MSPIRGFRKIHRPRLLRFLLFPALTALRFPAYKQGYVWLIHWQNPDRRSGDNSRLVGLPPVWWGAPQRACGTSGGCAACAGGTDGGRSGEMPGLRGLCSGGRGGRLRARGLSAAPMIVMVNRMLASLDPLGGALYGAPHFAPCGRINPGGVWRSDFSSGHPRKT